jgi:hypothetical protein
VSEYLSCECTFDINNPHIVRGIMNKQERAEVGQDHSVRLATILLIGFVFLSTGFVASCKKDSDSSSGSGNDSVPADLVDPSAVGVPGKPGLSKFGGPACVASAKKIDRSSVFVTDPSTGKIGFSSLRTAHMLPSTSVKLFRLTTEVLLESPYGKLGSDNPVRPISDPELIRRFDEAKRLILSLNPSCAWHWDKIKALVAKHGGYLIYDGDGAVNPYNPDRTAKGKLHSLSFYAYLRGKEKLEPTTKELALDMIRNATTVVFEEIIMEWAGYSMAHEQMAELSCEDFGFFKMHLEIMFITWNAHRARVAMHGGAFIPDSVLPSVEVALRAFDRGDSEDFFVTTGVVAKRINEAGTKTKMRTLLKSVNDGEACDYPPRLDAGHIGLEALPFDIDDGLLNLFERRMIDMVRKHRQQDRK